MALTGRAGLLALLAVPAVAVLAPGAAGVVAASLLVVGLAMLDVALAPSVRRLVLTRDGDTAVRLGEPATVRLTVRNPQRRALRALVRDAWPPSAGAVSQRHAVRVPPRTSRTVTTHLLPTRRGDRHAARVTVRALGPLGLAGRQGSHDVPWRLRALPPFTSRRHLPAALARLREVDGPTSVNVRGQGREFDSLRDYVEGDDVRSIDWRATARRQAVVVRTWRPERDRHVLLVVDTSRVAAGRVGDAPRLDAAMDAALLLAALAARAGDRVDLLAFDRRVRADVRGETGAALLPALVAALAPLEPELVEADWRALRVAVLARARRRSLVVLLTGLEPAGVEEGLLPVLPGLAQRHQLLVAAVADPRVEEMARGRADVLAVYGAAAAERARLERAAAGAALRRRGVEVLDEPPGRLAPALAERYLDLKAAGRL